MPARRKGALAAHAQREAKHANSGKGKTGRPSFIDNPRVLQKIMQYARVGIPARMLSVGLGYNEHYIDNLLNRGAAAIAEEDHGDKYAQFFHSWHAHRVDTKFRLLEALIESGDWRAMERALVRLDDGMDFVDRDRIAARPETNLNISLGGRPSAKASLDRAKALQESRYVDGYVSEQQAAGPEHSGREGGATELLEDYGDGAGAG